MTKSKVLIRSSGTLLTHPTPPRTDFLWNLFKSHLSSAFYCISHIPHHKVTNHHTFHRANTTFSPFWRTGRFGGSSLLKWLKELILSFLFAPDSSNFHGYDSSDQFKSPHLHVAKIKENLLFVYWADTFSLLPHAHKPHTMWWIPHAVLEAHTLLLYLWNSYHSTTFDPALRPKHAGQGP